MRTLSKILMYTAVACWTIIAATLINDLLTSAPRSPQAATIPAHIYVKLDKSVFMITNADQTSGGTGFLVKSSSGVQYVLTNEHVCSHIGDQIVAKRDGDEVSYILPIVEIDAEHDLCLLRAAAGQALELNPKEAMRYEVVYTLGHPLLEPNTPAKGDVLPELSIELRAGEPDLNGECPKDQRKIDSIFFSICVKRMTLRRTTVPTYPGSSGSPVVNEEGLLVGIINSGDQMNHGNYVPLRFIKALLSKH